jgi:ribosome-associated toxin RatA of RatAB toxin-antitoxin module
MPASAFQGLVLAAATWLASIPATAQGVDDSWIDWDRLTAGEILVESSSTERGTATINLAIAIRADWRSVWDVITACEVSPEYVPHVISCRRIATDSDANAELFRQTVKPAFFLPKFDHVFRLDYSPPERIDVHHVSGPIERLEGSWRLMPRPNGTIALLHSMTVNPAFPVPRFFVRNTLERDLPGVLAEIRRRAESAAQARTAD